MPERRSDGGARSGAERVREEIHRIEPVAPGISGLLEHAERETAGSGGGRRARRDSQPDAQRESERGVPHAIGGEKSGLPRAHARLFGQRRIAPGDAACDRRERQHRD